MTDDTPPLETLMARARAGDRRAYEALFRAIAPPLRAFVARRISAPADVEDVVQSILLSIHRSGHTYDSARPFGIWMYAIARRRLADYLRERYKTAGIRFVGLDAAAGINMDTDVTAGADNREYLTDMLDSLPGREKRIITMMKVEGYSARDVAKELGMSVSAVKVAAHRAYKALAARTEGRG